MALTRGEGLSRAAWNRMGWRVRTPMEACTHQPRASPPPMVLGDGMGVTSASPTDESSAESRGRRRAVKRTWQSAEGETADPWNAFCSAL